MSDFILDIKKIRDEARSHYEDGVTTTAYKADKETVLKILDASLATEWICVLRYTQHSLAAQGIHADSVAAHFREHAAEEQVHAMQLGERIKQLGGTPSLNPANLASRAHAEYREADNLRQMIKENLIAERIAIESYTSAIRYLSDKDPTTRRLLEEILAKEEEHADEMVDLLAGVDGDKNVH